MNAIARVLRTSKGLIEAPAGCGKTQLIVDALKDSPGAPALILTHTTAGVASLRHRLNLEGIASSHYRLATIAGWALSIAAMFPDRAGYVSDPFGPPDYNRLQAAVGELCKSGHIDDLLRATYSRLFIDEYQDCSGSQHLIAEGLSKSLKTVVFGDPLQAIFGFGDPLPDWEGTVKLSFPLLETLDVPWRWKNAGTTVLGDWILTVRSRLLNVQKVDLTTCPGYVFWNQLTGDPGQDLQAQVRAQYQISQNFPGDKILIIGDSINVDTRHRYASMTRGVGVVEPVDLRDVVRIAGEFDGLTGVSLLDKCIEFLILVMTNVYGPKLLARVSSIDKGRNRTEPTEPEVTAVALCNGGGYREAISFMQAMNADPDRRVYRLSAYNIMLEILSQGMADTHLPLDEIASRIREQRRHAGRALPFKAVGSTLLLKGLEAEHVLILDADNPRNRMSREHLYVALTRGSKSVTIFSRNRQLPL